MILVNILGDMALHVIFIIIIIIFIADMVVNWILSSFLILYMLFSDSPYMAGAFSRLTLIQGEDYNLLQMFHEA